MKLRSVKPTKGIRNWCGPVAMSMLTGRTVGYCAQLCAEEASNRRWRGQHQVTHTRKTIRGVHNDELDHAMWRMGYKLVNIHEFNGLTLFKMFETLSTKLWKAQLLINVTNHYVVGQVGVVYDSHCTEGCDSRKFWCRKRKVIQVWEVVKR